MGEDTPLGRPVCGGDGSKLRQQASEFITRDHPLALEDRGEKGDPVTVRPHQDVILRVERTGSGGLLRAAGKAGQQSKQSPGQ